MTAAEELCPPPSTSRPRRNKNRHRSLRRQAGTRNQQHDSIGGIRRKYGIGADWSSSAHCLPFSLWDLSLVGDRCNCWCVPYKVRWLFESTRPAVVISEWRTHSHSLILAHSLIPSAARCSPAQLEENGAFHWKCEPESPPDEVCAAQTSTLLNVQLVASVTEISGPLMGIFLDMYGAPWAAVFMSVCLGLGLLLLTLASAYTSVGWDRVLFVANVFLALCTWMGGQLTVQAGLYFDGHTKSRVIFLLNALFDGGCVTYLFVWWIAKGYNLSLAVVAGGYFVLGVLTCTALLYFWFHAVPESVPENKNENDPSGRLDDDNQSIVERDKVDHDDDERSRDASVASPESTGATAASLDEPLPTLSSSTVLQAADTFTPTKQSTHPASRSESLDSEEQRAKVKNRRVNIVEDPLRPCHSGNDATVDTTRAAVGQAETGQDYILVAHRTTRQQLLSGPYVLLCLFFSVQVTMNTWTTTTMRDFLAYLGDDELDNRYLTIFTLLLPASVVAVPLVDWVVLRFGFEGGFHATNLLALGYSIIRVATTNLDVQIGACPKDSSGTMADHDRARILFSLKPQLFFFHSGIHFVLLLPKFPLWGDL